MPKNLGHIASTEAINYRINVVNEAVFAMEGIISQNHNDH